ncbi:sigma-54-dependent Fis family transcriptional regulator [Roseobacter weihaiensis]|uniref:sigma-54-dependent Fis family transcriptional regulator n=1 Tax=Roseobacter weihaiensis TaxID=2763262 RepID=UPI001D0A3E0E|nr:helix-turn-helix domain-containing protein [Roseobacter sp. H9]
MEPRATKPILRLQHQEVSQRLERLKDTSNRIFREVDRAAAIVRKRGGLMVLSDADRIVVNVVQSKAYTSRKMTDGIAVGSCWDEKIAGTNGVHMGLLSGRPFTVRGTDHYYKALESFACTSVPILDAEEVPIGSLTLSTIDRRVGAEYEFAQNLLGVTASRIHRELFLSKHSDRRILKVARSGFPPAREALLAIDDEGLVCAASSPALQTLAVSDASQIVGEQIENLLDVSLHQVDGGLERTRVGLVDGETLFAEGVELERSVRPAPGRPMTAVTRRRHPALDKLAVGNPSLKRQLKRAAQVLAEGVPVHVCGPLGAGKSTVVQALIAQTDPKQDVFTINATRSEHLQSFNVEVLEQIYAGACLEDLPLQMLVIENVEDLPQSDQECVVQLMERLERDAANTAGCGARNLRVVTTSRCVPSDTEGTLREDLLSHLAATTIRLEPLEARPDRRAILSAIAEQLATEVIEITEDTWAIFEQYSWPRNIREAWSVLREAVLCGDGRQITPVDLPDHLQTASSVSTPLGAKSYSEEDRIRDALNTTSWNVSLAARNLGIGRATLNRRIAQLNLKRPGRA